MRKTFKSSSLCNISNFHNVFFLIYRRFRDHVLNELRVSFNHVAQKHSSKKVKDAFAVYICIKLSVSYFILRSSNFWKKYPSTLKFGTNALEEMFLNNVCTFFMKLFVSKDSFLLTKLSISQNWNKSIKFIIKKTICFLKNVLVCFQRLS